MDTQKYYEFLASKIKVAERQGIEADKSELHHSTKPHQADIILWALHRGSALIAADTGMGKSHMAIEVLRIINKRHPGKSIIVTELGAAGVFTEDDPEVSDGARLGVKIDYVTNMKEAIQSECNIVLTNYERVRMGAFDFSKFTSVWLDEGNYLKNMSSETTNELNKQLQKVKFKYVATATPSPNEHLEIVNYAHALGITERGLILTRFFQRNSTKAGELTIHPQHEDDFWLWVSSWAVFIQLPSDLGYDDEGYLLPTLFIKWHEVKMNKQPEAKVDRFGRKEMYVTATGSLPDAAKIKRTSIDDRISAIKDIMLNSDDDKHWIIWHHLEDERKHLNEFFKNHPSYKDIFGKQDWREKEKRTVEFSKGEFEILATKPEINGVGCNFQKHCHKNILLGVNHDFNEFYQLIKRTHRYGQNHNVFVHVLYVPEEYDIVNNLKRKWLQHDEMRAKMREIISKYGLSQSGYIEDRKRTFRKDRIEYKGERYLLVNNDCVPEVARLDDNSVDMILTSIPFGNHYEYTDSYNDFGHNINNGEFFKQMDFLVPELLRVLKPGRIAAIHTKNRIHYGSVTGKGFSTFHRFSHATADCFERNGFDCIGFHFVPTDVVAENNQTYRLGYSEACKDMTKMGSGIPEEIWLFRKQPTDTSNAYADEPVTHDKSQYSLANWQIDADAFWKSNGNRYLTTRELRQWGIDKLQAWWKEFNSEVVYDYEEHVKLLQSLDKHNKLSRKFTTLPLRSNTDFIWNDNIRMHNMNAEQSRRKLQNHICPMPFDQVDRLLELYSNPGDVILDPFGGIGTTGIRSLKKCRKAILFELNKDYAKTASIYLKEEEFKINQPTLFDILTA